jgi:16S rRNA (adenine1518-N6/adenine1519-N6)-dimethyltransferase
VTALPAPSRKLLEELGVRPSKGRGQNFLKEPWVVKRIAAELGSGPGDLVIEIGPGLGALTGALLATGAEVHAVEIEAPLAGYLREAFANQPLTVFQTDARTVSIDEIVPDGRAYDLAANLPFSSAPVILRHFLESERPPVRSICMVQREVGLRITARPPEMSILSVAVQLYAGARVLFDVPPDAFVPKPKVTSSVVLLDRHEEQQLSPDERPAFFQLVNAGFAQKRKTLLNSLSAALPVERQTLRGVLDRAGIDPMRRAETLSIGEWITLLHALGDV